jgi:hypothetical protein
VTRKMGDAVSALPDAAKLEMMETVKAVIDMSIYPADAWRDLLLVYVVNESHDQGVDRKEFEHAVAECIDEEWSTPNTTGRVAERNRRRN